jgi:aminoglycoside phosphotransferase (APT) family kinase protein
MDPLRRRPPAPALEWACEAVGAGSRIVSVRPLPSSWLANHAVTVADRHDRRHRLVLRRWARPGWHLDDPDYTAQREATILELLAPSAVPAPEVVAADPNGTACDVPALLLTRLPGRPPAPTLADQRGFLTQLAEELAAIHAVNGQAQELVPAYRTYVRLDGLTRDP